MLPQWRCRREPRARRASPQKRLYLHEIDAKTAQARGAPPAESVGKANPKLSLRFDPLPFLSAKFIYGSGVKLRRWY
jgi:hypothetical protein